MKKVAPGPMPSGTWQDTGPLGVVTVIVLPAVTLAGHTTCICCMGWAATVGVTATTDVPIPAARGLATKVPARATGLATPSKAQNFITRGHSCIRLDEGLHSIDKRVLHHLEEREPPQLCTSAGGLTQARQGLIDH